MDFIAAAANYLLGAPILGLGTEVGFVWKALLLLVGLLIFTAYILLADRKIWAAVQVRRGPNVVGPFGLLQSFADLLKFVFKEPSIPASADKVVFLLAPLVTSILALSAYAVIPIDAGWALANINLGVLYIFAISSLGVYGIIMGGWASNSKYPFLGGLRSAAQMVSYEVSIGFIIITVLLLVGSLNLTTIVNAQSDGIWMWHGFRIFYFAEFPANILVGVTMLAMLGMFFISALAETNRPPFDLPEAESELVAGYQVEYSSTPYLLFMIGEYLNIVMMCAMTTILFLGGWHLPWGSIESLGLSPFWTSTVAMLVFYAKLWVMFFMFAMVKAFVPRYRYDQLMRLGWKVFLPLSLFMVVATAAFLKIMGFA